MALRSALLSALLIVAAGANAQGSPPEGDLRVSEADRQFLQLAVDSSAKEIQLSERALEQGESADVKRFAETMVKDHGATNRDLMSLVEALFGTKGPPFKKASESVKREVEQLSELDGPAFDRRYMQIMIKDHRAAVNLYRQQADRDANPQIKALAKKTLPTLERHLNMARAVAPE